jgi:hypothetical protein
MQINTNPARTCDELMAQDDSPIFVPLNRVAWSAIHIAIRRLSRKGCGCVLTYYVIRSARNAGAACTHGEIVLFIDSDCVPAPSWACEMAQTFETPEVELVMGRTRTMRSGDFLSNVQEGSDLVASESRPAAPRQHQPTSTSSPRSPPACRSTRRCASTARTPLRKQPGTYPGSVAWEARALGLFEIHL